jgi:hypothetical protein
MTPETQILKNSEFSRPELAALRAGEFGEGEDWIRGERRRVEWTGAGLKRLAEKMGISVEDLAGGDAGVGKGEVIWANYPNRTLVQVKPTGSDLMILVKVKDARLYLPGMEMTYEANGPRGWVESRRPRSRGRF